ncbi:MAG: helix-turn-helix transcriptional regulator [Pseudomonadales bacterium]|nr:helix-turn-helix transcriptional regulator [Pseudomonadales bacterium]
MSESMNVAAFGSLLKQHRKSRRFSQMDLANEAEISTRHLSFLETGRASPSRDMVLHLARVMDVSLKDINLMLSAAGYTQEFSQRNITDPEMQAAFQALQLLLQSHEPYPAVVLDSHWNLLMVNETQQKLGMYLIEAGAKLPATTNFLDQFFAPQGYRDFVDDWESFAIYLLQRSEKEFLLQGDTEAIAEHVSRWSAYPGVPKDWRQVVVGFDGSPMLQLTIRLKGKKLNLFSTIAAFGSPLDITLQGIRIEHYFPADEPTKTFFESL